MSLKELIARDITGIFMNVNDFCDNLNIQIGRKKFNVIGSLQSNTVTNNSGSNAAPLQSDTWVLYIKYPLLDDLETENILSAGQRIIISNNENIKDMVFTIVSVSDEMGLATIQLSNNSGR